MDNVFFWLYVIFCAFLVLWILYDIVNLLIKKCTYDVVEAEVFQPEKGNSKSSYHIKLKYFYDNKINFYLTKWATNILLPKIGAKRKIYINKNDSTKVYFFDFKIFTAFSLFRLAFIIPLIIKIFN